MKAKIYNFADIDINCIAAALKIGAAAVLPTDTVYGLCAAAPEKINKIKNNPPGKPPQVLCTIAQAFKLAAPSPQFTAAAKLWPGALTLIAAVSPEGRKLMGGEGTIGLRVPDDEFILSLIQKIKAPLFASSANIHGAPVCETEAAVKEVFETAADIIVLRGDIKTAPSAVIDFSGPQAKIIRPGALSENVLKQLK